MKLATGVSPLGLAMNTVRGWVRLYTSGLPAAIQHRRRAEVDSDLWEQGEMAAEETASNAGHILARLVLGMPADISWHIAELGGPTMERSMTAKALVAGTVVLGGLSIALGVGLLIGLAEGGWSLNDGADFVLFLALLAGLAGPFAALAGAYALRRAEAENKPQRTGRALLVAGTLGIAAIAGAVWWTIVGPIVAVGIVLYWLVRLGGWRSQQRHAV